MKATFCKRATAVIGEEHPKYYLEWSFFWRGVRNDHTLLLCSTFFKLNKLFYCFIHGVNVSFNSFIEIIFYNKLFVPHTRPLNYHQNPCLKYQVTLMVTAHFMKLYKHSWVIGPLSLFI